MAMITQSGVDLLTRGTRAQFDAENKARLRKRRLRQAATGNYRFDPNEQAVEMERLRQQTEDLNAEQQGVRQRYATDPVFSGPTQLFDASNIIDLPAAIAQRHGRMSANEMVRTEKDRVNGGGRSGWTFDPESGQTKSNAWGPEDNYNAGAALGSRPMMQQARETMSIDRDKEEQKAEAEQMREDMAEARSRGQAARSKRLVQFDVAVSRGETPANTDYRRQLAGLPQRGNADNGPMGKVRSRVFGDFAGGDPVVRGSGGTINRGGVNFDVSPGYSDSKRQAMPRKAPAFDVQGIGRQYEATKRPDPYAGLESMPRPVARLSQTTAKMERGKPQDPAYQPEKYALTGPLSMYSPGFDSVLTRVANVMTGGDLLRKSSPPTTPAPVIDSRYHGSSMGSRTGAKALASPPVFDPFGDVLFTHDNPNAAAFNDLAGMRSVDPWLDAVGGAWSDIKSKAAKPKRVFDAWSESQQEAELRRQARMRAGQRPRPQSIAGPRSSLYGVRQAPSFAVASGY